MVEGIELYKRFFSGSNLRLGFSFQNLFGYLKVNSYESLLKQGIIFM